MKSIRNTPASRWLVLLAAAFGLATPAYAVNDLPGGPAVNQLNLPPAASAIAQDLQGLHWFMLIICLAIFVAVFAVMFIRFGSTVNR